MIPSATYVFADAQTHISLYTVDMHTPVLNQIRGLFNYSKEQQVCLFSSCQEGCAPYGW